MSWTTLSRMILQWFLPFQRLFMYVLTGKSLLERIIANRTLPFPLRVYQIKYSIDFTSTKNLKSEIEQMTINKHKSLIHNQLYAVVHKLELYQKLIKQVNEIRMIQVTSTEEEHLALFEKLWSRLVLRSNTDYEEMNMISRRWMKIGFQVCRKWIKKEFIYRVLSRLGSKSINRFSR